MKMCFIRDAQNVVKIECNLSDDLDSLHSKIDSENFHRFTTLAKIKCVWNICHKMETETSSYFCVLILNQIGGTLFSLLISNSIFCIIWILCVTQNVLIHFLFHIWWQGAFTETECHISWVSTSSQMVAPISAPLIFHLHTHSHIKYFCVNFNF